MQHLTTRVTPFQSIAVWGHAREVEFRVTGAIHAWWHRDRFLTGLAWDNMAAGVLSHPGTPRSLLMMGLGGGTSLRTLRHLLPDLDITAVEIDSGMVELAQRYMNLNSLGIDVVTADASLWLRRNRRRFDVIFDDVYGVSATDVIRPDFDAGGLPAMLDRSLAPGGIFAANLVLGAGHRNTQSAFRRFFARQFDCVRSVTTEASLNETLAGGAALRPWREVRALAAEFTSEADRLFWQRLRGRRLPSESARRRTGLAMT